MTGQAGEKPKRQTWRDWTPGAPEPQLLTRDELLAAAERLHIAADERSLRYWESPGVGVLPGPIQRRHRGKTRALYPHWMVDLIYKLHRYRDQGFTLKELPDRMRAEARRIAHDPPLWRFIPGEGARNPLEAFLADFYADLQEPPREPVGHPFLPVEPTPTLRRRLTSAAGVLAAVLGETDGITIARAELRLTDTHGRTIDIPIPLPDPDADPAEGGA